MKLLWKLICGSHDATIEGHSPSIRMGHSTSVARRQGHARFVNPSDERDSISDCGKPEILSPEGEQRSGLQCYIGDKQSTTIHRNHAVFHHLSTVALPRAFVKHGQKLFYEVTFEGKVNDAGGSVSYIGWATSEFKPSQTPLNRCVGWCGCSWGYEGQHHMKYHNNRNKTWGKQFEPTSGVVLGVAADLVEGRLLYGLDGSWDLPMGVAFEDIDTKMEIFPAISAHNMKVFVNFGEIDFMYGPPDSSFVKVSSVT